MELFIKPFYDRGSILINTSSYLGDGFDEDDYAHTCSFEAGFDMCDYDDEDREYLVAQVCGMFFEYDKILNDDEDIIDVADTIDNDTLRAISVIKNNEFISEDNCKNSEFICYLSRVYIYPEFRNQGIATYIFENLQEIFEYITGKYTNIIVVYPKPQEPINDGWRNSEDVDGVMKNNMIKMLNKNNFIQIDETGFYVKVY